MTAAEGDAMPGLPVAALGKELAIHAAGRRMAEQFVVREEILRPTGTGALR